MAAGWLSTCQTKDACPSYTMVWAVARLTKKGKPDTTFGGGDGLVTLKPSRATTSSSTPMALRSAPRLDLCRRLVRPG
ncbi:MAG: hypothetical protein U0R78_14065 [Nocardioidaceae bacterium]